MTESDQTSLVKVFSQADFNNFARLSGDDNPIHTDPDFCSGTRFGRTVAHGLLLCSVLRGLIDRVAPGARLSEQSVMFPAPTYAGEAMRFTIMVNDRGAGMVTDHGAGMVKDRGAGEIELDLEVRRIDDGVVTCQGQARVVS